MNKTPPILLWIIGPLMALLLFSPWSAQLDLMTSRYFFRDGAFMSHPFFDAVYQYGILFAWIVVGISCVVFFLSLFNKAYLTLRKPALFLILTLGIGSGLIVHAALKDHWGRPRPRQTTEFGGYQSFRAYYQPNFLHQPEPSKSFPCGHCSMGFYFFAVAMLGLYYRNKKLYYSGLAFAWLLGGVLGFVRIAQGGHFLSDVFVAAIIMWLTTLALYYLLLKPQECHEGTYKKAT